MFQVLLAVIYLSFISLGLPDALLGSAWPSMYTQFGVSYSVAGCVSMIIAVGTIFSSLQSDRLTRALGTGKVTAISVAMTAAALFGFSTCTSFPMLCLWAIPYGLGAGSVDASLNNYVALHYTSRDMSWLHCMWGIGASVGPYIMGFALTNGMGWPMGYRIVGILQVCLTAVLVFSLPLWKGRGEALPNADSAAEQSAEPSRPLSIPEVLRIPGAKEIFMAFFCYCAVEQTALLWGCSYLTLHNGMDAAAAASWASLFTLGITFGRGVNGFLAMRLNDTQLIRLGQGIVAAGALLILLGLGGWGAPIGLVLLGLGCAPIYPCIIHSTPDHFGAERSQAVIGMQMAFAYLGTCLMPPLFGVIANRISIGLFPAYLLFFLVLMVVAHERLCRRSESQAGSAAAQSAQQ